MDVKGAKALSERLAEAARNVVPPPPSKAVARPPVLREPRGGEAASLRSDALAVARGKPAIEAALSETTSNLEHSCEHFCVMLRTWVGASTRRASRLVL